MSKCIIIGAGAIGLLSARLLAQAGHEVQIIERGEPGMESSWAGGGILSPLYPWRYPDSINQLADYGQQHYPALIQSLRDETGIDPQLLNSGMLLLDSPEAGINDWAKQWNHPVKFPTSSTALRAIQPGLSTAYQSATWLPDLKQIRNPRLMAALLASTKLQSGITITANTPVTGLITDQQRTTGVRTENGDHHADTVLICAGAWSSGLIPDGATKFRRIEPVKGQMLQFQAPPDLLSCMVMENSRYLIPRKDGLILAGSTLEHTEFNKNLTDNAREQLRNFAIGVLPVLAKMPVVNHWAGLRPGTSQGIPLIGEHPDIAGLYVNAGHFRYGIIIGLASAQLAVNLITRSTPIFNPADYHL